jgi:hypothetical protein
VDVYMETKGAVDRKSLGTTGLDADSVCFSAY